jgi:hypothetical protein
MSAKPIRPLATVTGSYTMLDTDSIVIASGVNTVVTLPIVAPTGHQATVVRADPSNVVKVATAGGDVISLAGAQANQRSLNTNGAAITLQFVPSSTGGVWFVVATMGTVI